MVCGGYVPVCYAAGCEDEDSLAVFGFAGVAIFVVGFGGGLALAEGFVDGGHCEVWL